jgi:hypothetical protein
MVSVAEPLFDFRNPTRVSLLEELSSQESEINYNFKEPLQENYPRKNFRNLLFDVGFRGLFIAGSTGILYSACRILDYYDLWKYLD